MMASFKVTIPSWQVNMAKNRKHRPKKRTFNRGKFFNWLFPPLTEEEIRKRFPTTLLDGSEPPKRIVPFDDKFAD